MQGRIRIVGRGASHSLRPSAPAAPKPLTPAQRVAQERLNGALAALPGPWPR